MAHEKVEVHITKIETGETRIDRDFDWDRDDENADFIWCDGNFACDCNRYLFFERAGGREPTDDEDSLHGNCGMTAYSVKITALNGDVLYDEPTNP